MIHPWRALPPRLIVILAPFALASSCSGRGAGERSDSVVAKSPVHSCATAIPIVARRQLDTLDDWAWSVVPGCGAAGGVAARVAWLSLRSETDPRRISAVYDRLATFRDASLFDALRQTLLDERSSAPLRVHAAMALVDQLMNGREADYATFADTSAEQSPCALDYVTDQKINAGAPLPSDARAQVRVAASVVSTGRNAPPSVMRAARCLVEVLDREDRTSSRRSQMQPSVPR